jgi:hypothetical protein
LCHDVHCGCCLRSGCSHCNCGAVRGKCSEDEVKLRACAKNGGSGRHDRYVGRKRYAFPSYISVPKGGAPLETPAAKPPGRASRRGSVGHYASRGLAGWSDRAAFLQAGHARTVGASRAPSRPDRAARGPAPSAWGERRPAGTIRSGVCEPISGRQGAKRRVCPRSRGRGINIRRY